MHRYQDSGKRNRRKGKTEHVTSPVGQMPEGALSFRAIVLTNEEWPQILGDIYEVFHLVEGICFGEHDCRHPQRTSDRRSFLDRAGPPRWGNGPATRVGEQSGRPSD